MLNLAYIAFSNLARFAPPTVGGGLQPPRGGPPPPHPPSEDFGPTVRGHRSLAIEGRRPQAAQDLGKFSAGSQQVLGTHGQKHAKILKKLSLRPSKIEAGRLENRVWSPPRYLFKDIDLKKANKELRENLGKTF